MKNIDIKAIEALRKQCLKMLIDSGLNRLPRYRLASLINPEAPENPQALSMALTGYRKTASAHKVLERLHGYLTSKTNKAA